MWNFFFLFLIGVYLLIKYTEDKADDNANKAREKLIAETELKIRATYGMETKLEEALVKEDTRWKTLDYISDELREVYGDEWKSRFREDAVVESISVDILCISRPYGVAFNILLAKHGKIPNLTFQYDLGGVREVEFAVKGCQIVERCMQEMYPDMKMVYGPGSKINGKLKEYYPEVHRGKIYWEYNAPRYARGFEPPITRLW